jgi:prepilin-type N-terminal cleavage/methylation domain-containing protein
MPEPVFPSSQRGFSLIEMLVMVVLLGIVTGMALAKVDYTRGRVNSSAMHLASELSAAQRLAISLQHDVRVSFEAATGTLLIHEDTNNDDIIQPTERSRRVALEDGVRFARATAPALAQVGPNDLNYATEGGTPVLTFRRDGSASQGGGFYVTSDRHATLGAAYAKDACGIEVIRSTGRVVRWRYSSGSWRSGN